MSDGGALARLAVSRETLDRLEALEALLKKWNPAINLVAKSTLGSAWDRHILDSAQLYTLAPPKVAHWADLGSGGGFPGLVIAALSHELDPDRRVTLVESDRRKATFLREAARQLGLSAEIRDERIESLDEFVHLLVREKLVARHLRSLARVRIRVRIWGRGRVRIRRRFGRIFHQLGFFAA